MSDDRFEIEPPQYYEETKSSGGCLKGCLIVLIVIVILGVIVGFWVAMNLKGWVADIGSEAIGQMIDESEWPEQEKGEVKVEVDRLADAFRKGEISGDQLAIIMEQIIESPLWTTMAVAAIEKKYVENSGLNEEEKQAGRVDMRRFLRGMVTKQLSEEDFDTAISKLAVKDDKGLWEMKESATDEELRELFAVVKEKVDAAEIPPEVEDVDPSDEMKRIIDEALGEGIQVAAPIEKIAE